MRLASRRWRRVCHQLRWKWPPSRGSPTQLRHFRLDLFGAHGRADGKGMKLLTRHSNFRNVFSRERHAFFYTTKCSHRPRPPPQSTYAQTQTLHNNVAGVHVCSPLYGVALPSHGEACTSTYGQYPAFFNSSISLFTLFMEQGLLAPPVAPCAAYSCDMMEK